MKNLVKTRNWIIIILCITIIFLVTGFAILSMKLTTDKKEEPTFAVEFIKAEPRTPVQGGIISPKVTSSITNSNQTINIEFYLYAPRDEIGYKITIKNTGNLPAKIINLVEKPDYATDPDIAKTIFPVSITQNNVIGKVLEPGEETELTIVAMFDYNFLPQDIKVSYQLSVIAKTP